MLRWNTLLPSILIPAAAIAGVATQTDWDHGPGVPGPVSAWSNYYDSEDQISWQLNGRLDLRMLRTPIVEDFGGAASLRASDMDGDGDLDLLAVASEAGEIAWFERSGSAGLVSWTEHGVATGFEGAASAFPVDMDGDGDQDVLGAAYEADEIAWWENLDHQATVWVKHPVAGSFWGARQAVAGDFDGDGDNDIVGIAQYVDGVTLWEQPRPGGNAWIRSLIDTDFGAASCVAIEDLDGDGDPDVVASAEHSTHEITWWENGQTEPRWTRHLIQDEAKYARSVCTGDVDGDGDIDVAGRTTKGVHVWLNLNGAGTLWSVVKITAVLTGQRVLFADVDQDGDLDVLYAMSSRIDWYENTTGSGTAWVAHTPLNDFLDASSAVAMELDDDGFLEIVGSSTFDDQICWVDHIAAYEPGGNLTSSILYLHGDPGWGSLDATTVLPGGCAVCFQVRASDNASSMGPWSESLAPPLSLAGLLPDQANYFQYRVLLSTTDSSSSPTLNDVTLTWDPVPIIPAGASVPDATGLLPSHPNPVSGSPVIRFVITEPLTVELSLFDLTGRLVDSITAEYAASGLHARTLEPLSPGIYFVRMIAGEYAGIQRFVVMD
jgi:hypothetical protein